MGSFVQWLRWRPYRASVLFKNFVIAFSLCSFAFATNILDKGSAEASSPEDQFQKSLPSFDPLSNLSTDPFAADPQIEKSGGKTPSPQAIPPLVNSGVFPYQPNIIGAIISAAVTMGVMSFKETGKVDLEGIAYLLNSSDFYAGLLGTVVNGYTQKGVSWGVVKGFGLGAKASPTIIKPFVDAQMTKVLGSIVNGVTYTAMVSIGFEEFSQFWMYATKKIPEAQTFTGMIAMPFARKMQVVGNLMDIALVNGALQKRIRDSVWNHRVMTFEFIATNIAMYIGGQLGFLVAKK